MRIQKNIPEYNLAIGECYMNLEKFREAIQYISIAVRSKPRNAGSWEALIRCLYKAGYFEEAARQCQSALAATENRPIFYYLLSAALFANRKKKQAMIYLEEGLNKAPRIVKKFIEINPSILQNNEVVDILAMYKKKKKI